MNTCKNYKSDSNNHCLNCKRPLLDHIAEHNLELYELIEDDTYYEPSKIDSSYF